MMRAPAAPLLCVAVMLWAPGCSRGRPDWRAPPGADGGSAILPASDDLVRIARAEDRRRAVDLPGDVQGRTDVALRRAAARALARIVDPDDGPLLRALEDEDDEVVAWASYGLGESCKGHEDRHVRALAARLVSREAERGEGATGDSSLPGATRIGRRVVATMLRALGRCGSDAAEAVVRSWVSKGGPEADAACYALGDIASRRGSLSDDSARALLDVALGASPTDAALAAFGRPDVTFDADFDARLVSAARRSLARTGPLRVLAVRALARTHAPDVAGELARILTSESASPAERIEAAAGLAQPPASRTRALGEAISPWIADRGRRRSGDDFTVLLSAAEKLDASASRDAQTLLDSLARSPPLPGSDPAALRRASALRCAAAGNLAREAWDDAILRSCDVGDGEAGQGARLRALDRRPIVGARRSAWIALARSAHSRVRESALEAIPRHPELGDAAREALAAALTSEAPGVVAVAAKVVRLHPGAVFVLAASERLAALDPSSPPPTSTPATELYPPLARALRTAIARPWRHDRIETRAALFEAALEVGVEEGRAAARQGCRDENATLRARAGRALIAAGEAPCEPSEPAPAALAPEIGHALTHRMRVSFDTEGGPVAIVLDPTLAPVAVTRLVALARSGFYTGGSLHRVVPGFVVQFGDPEEDGYGGSGELLRCETSPVPFEALDVGVATAGRDTGSSQLFVTLSPSPQLDGQYTWVGRARGDWDAIAQGDRIRAVRVEEEDTPPP
jgi:cyclophilin family peptidyl-prolyl cis-trans isomerase